MTDHKHRGFTLIELMLAMAFISFLILFIVSAILQATRLYTKGLAIRQINQTGRQVVDSIAKSSRYANPTYLLTFKRLCVGGVAYAWNADDEPSTSYKNKLNDASSTVIRFTSVQDPTGALCQLDPLGNPPVLPAAKAVDLVGGDITPLHVGVSQAGRLWDISLVLSTAGSNAAVPDATATGGYSCDPNNQFCAFGQFEASVYSRGG